MSQEAINWEEFDAKVDAKAINEDIEYSKENFGEQREVPHGDYEVKISNMELKTSKKGDPMLSIWFKILDGKYKNSIIFYNQVINQGFQIHMANEMLRSLDSGVEVESLFRGYAYYSKLVMDIYEAIDETKLEYALSYGENAKGFNTYKIIDVFES